MYTPYWTQGISKHFYRAPYWAAKMDEPAPKGARIAIAYGTDDGDPVAYVDGQQVPCHAVYLPGYDLRGAFRQAWLKRMKYTR